MGIPSDPTILFLYIQPRETCTHVHQEWIYVQKVHSGIVHNNQQLETVQMFTDNREDK